jgi:uncharacterized protein (TIGR02996 family)
LRAAQKPDRRGSIRVVKSSPMIELDYAALAASLEPGSRAAFQLVSEVLGVRLDRPDLEHLKRRCTEASDRHLGPALVFAVLRRCLNSEEGLAWERLEDRGSFSHVFAVRWEAGPGQHRVTIGIARHFRSRKLEAVWPELSGWKRTLSDNLALATAWARRPAQTDRLTLVVAGQLPSARANPHEEEGLLAAIAAQPEDDGPRLVYADWLMERGDARGEFIRLQCEDAREPPSQERTARLEAMLRASWSNFAGELAPWAHQRAFSRGLVSSVRMTIAAFARHGARLFGRHPLQHLEVDNRSFTPAQLTQLGGLPHLGLVSSLGLSQVDPDATRRPLAALAGGQLRSLRKLRLHSCGHSAADWSALFGSLDAPCLEEVAFTFNHTHPALFEALARLPQLRRVREYPFKLLPGAKAAGWRGALEALAQVPLEELILEQVEHLGDDEVSLFFAAQAQARLTRLELNGSSVTDRFLERVASSPRARTLKLLRVENGRFSLGGVRAVLESKQLSALSHLALTGRPADAPWSVADLEALCAMLTDLPEAHPLQVIGFPAGLDRDDLVQKLMKRFTLVY